MAFLDEEFSVDTLPQSTGGDFAPLPAGWYQVNITGAEIKATKAGTGKYIAIKYTILGPSFQGRIVFGNLNIKNPNPKAEEIGRQDLGSIMRAIGLAKVTDTDQLLGGSLEIKLAVTKSEQYGEGNEVKGYKALEGSMPAMPKPAPFGGVAAAPAAPVKASAPWAKK